MIPTRVNYDSEFCGKIPLDRINVIQPYGALLVLHPQTFTIIQCSQNTADILGIPHEQLVGQALSDILTPESDERFRNLVQLLSGSSQLPDTLVFRSGQGELPLLALFHATPDYLLLEAEPIHPQKDVASFSNLYQDLKKSMAAVNAATTLPEVCQAALVELKKLTGFDRLMMYRFDGNWNGKVIAEVLEPGMEPYLNLQFPASDIPKTSREMYRTNPYRHIPNRDYTPVGLYPVVNPINHTFTDLSPCQLRGVAPVHIEYLVNMGVKASMSTRILVQDELWGLISCHHRTPRHLSYEESAIFELISNMLATKVVAMEKEQSNDLFSTLQKEQVKVIEQVLLHRDLVSGLLADGDSLCQLLGAQGVAVSSRKQIHVTGKTPPVADIESLIYWLQVNHNTSVVQISRLGDFYEPANDLGDTASGIVILPIRPEQGDYVIGFRPELIYEVAWGGNPNEAVQISANGKDYHPRNSFDSWLQTVRGTSRDWTEPELQIAERFRNFLQDFLLREFSRRLEIA
ncbi:MAG: GAF domain-containing protein [Sphingobacteriales bacterium]|nr:MAG: GAF domain-containing protein [Sphingobacteriales bacterium]